MNVVQGQEATGHRFLPGDVVQGAARVLLARQARAVGVQLALVVRKAWLRELQDTFRCQRGAKTCSAARIHAVEHVHAERNAHYNVDGVAHAHEVARLVARQTLRTHGDSLPEELFCFSAAESADCVPRAVPLDHLVETAPAEVQVRAALDDAEQLLLLCVLVGGDAAVEPADGTQHSLLQPRPRREDVHNVIELHHNIAPKSVLYAHRVFGLKQQHRPVVAALELDALLRDLREAQQRDHLEAAGIRQDVPVPTSETVKATDGPQQLLAGPQPQVVRVSQQQLAPEAAHLFVRQALHGTLRAHGHEHGGADGAVRQLHSAGSRVLVARVECVDRRRCVVIV
eukprot:PhM_4_TR16236/c0_g1_i1/m.98587